jgi:acyl-CoA synthetase (NDP forming)
MPCSTSQIGPLSTSGDDERVNADFGQAMRRRISNTHWLWWNSDAIENLNLFIPGYIDCKYMAFL